MLSKNFHRKVANKDIGIGGMKCPCCGPAKGKKRKQFLRIGRKRLNNFLNQLIKEMNDEK